MTTESRMREALEESAWAIQELLALIHGECPGILDSDRGGSWAQVERIDKALASAMEALSPPARRTSAAEAEVERLRELLKEAEEAIRLAIEWGHFVYHGPKEYRDDPDVEPCNDDCNACAFERHPAVRRALERGK